MCCDECRDCAHSFQNPRPTADGLLLRHHRHTGEDDLGADPVGRRRRRHLRGAARALPPHSEPEGWLDVGTGHGHFPEVAREIHPYTSFDGLDPTPRVDRAWEAGRVEEAYRGLLTDPAYWSGQVREPVQFAAALAAAHQLGHRVFLEVGPAATLTAFFARLRAV